METKTIILTASITANFFSWSIILILWFRKCKECGKDKELGKAFSKHCEKCSKNANGNKTEKPKKKETIEVF